jgi:uncharacterized metal-binding protein YceD (DUF177 family)
MPGLEIDISELSSNPGASKEVLESSPIHGVKVPLGWVDEDEPVDMSLIAESIFEGILVTGEVAGVLHMSCSRCLRDFEEPFNHSVEETFYYSRPEETYQVEGERIDLEPMVRDVILLAIPLTPLHTPNCRGLCPVCGQDRNEVDCGHTQDTSDMRWAPLKELVLEEPKE